MTAYTSKDTEPAVQMTVDTNRCIWDYILIQRMLVFLADYANIGIAIPVEDNVTFVKPQLELHQVRQKK